MRINDLVDVKFVVKEMKDEHRHYSIGLSDAELEKSFMNGLTYAERLIGIQFEKFEENGKLFSSPKSIFMCAAHVEERLFKRDMELIFKSFKLIEDQMSLYGDSDVGRTMCLHICSMISAYSIIAQLTDLDAVEDGVYSVSVYGNDYEIEKVEVEEEVFA